MMADIEPTRAIVNDGETYDGKIIPTTQAEIDRPVRVYDGATVHGSIYGETVEISDEAIVEGSVMASEAVELTNGRVTGEVGSPGRVHAKSARVAGTVTGKRVRLTNCIIRGNVVGMNVILENSVVLGIVTADRELTVEDTVCYTVRSEGDTILDDTTTILPQIAVGGTLDLKTPVTVAGLGDLNVEEAKTEADTADELRLPVMTNNDRYEQNGTTYLSLSPRILNLERVTERLDQLEDAVMQTVADTSDDEGATMGIEDVFSHLEADIDPPKPVE